MMRLTGRQAHVLTHLDRVETRLPTVQTLDNRRRFYLDEVDCTSQITSLVVKKFVVHSPSGPLRTQTKLSASPNHTLERFIVLIRAVLAGASLALFGGGHRRASKYQRH